MIHPLRIFISSPSDVRPERLIAQRVVERLGREFAYHFRIEPVLWERQPLIATEHFQTKITPPSRPTSWWSSSGRDSARHCHRRNSVGQLPAGL